MAAHSVVMQNDPRRFSEASIGPPPRPPPPNFKRPKSQRRPVGVPVPGTQWPPHMLVSAAPQPQIQPPILIQTQPQPQPLPQLTMGSSNLAKMTQMARSTPQLDDSPDSRDRDRGRDKPHHPQNPRDGLIAQVTFHLSAVRNRLFFL